MSDEALIFLVHRIPYPPNKGDKIRSFHLLRHLARRYRVHLGAFADDPADLEHAATLSRWCTDVHIETIHPRLARVRALTGLLSGEALSIPYYRSPAMRQWLERTVAATKPRTFVAFSAAMAQYADSMPPGVRRILDMVDVDSEKWRAYGATRHGPAGWIYRREGERLLAWERTAAATFDATVLVSPAERDLFLQRAPEAAERVVAISNGVDTGYFTPEHPHANPYARDVLPIVFTGAMDYWPNGDAVTWFVDEVLPRVRETCPEARFHVVGTRPTPAVRALESRPGVQVVGAVPDVRPWLAHARVVVAPLRLARGIQNKVLEGLAMDRPVVATSAALDGLELDGRYPLRADSAVEFAARTRTVLAAPRIEPAWRMRRWVTEGYGWDARLAPFDRLLDAGRRSASEGMVVTGPWTATR